MNSIAAAVVPHDTRYFPGKARMMTKILILYYSTYGHVETMAASIAAGAREGGGDVFVKRVPELMPDDIARKAGAKLDQDAPLATPGELDQYDAIIFGTPTRFGNMASQMRNFLDQTGSLWMHGKLIGKIGSVFTSTGTGGGQETTITSFHSTLLHHGMVVVGLPYSSAGLSSIDQLRGGSPYGAATIAGSDGSRTPSAIELQLAHDQGRHVASISARLGSTG